MKGLSQKKQTELLQGQTKTHFKLYKAGRRWLVAGISIVSGLLGGGTAMTTVAKAQTITKGASKTVAPDEVTATQQSATIPVSSQSATETSTSEQSTSETSVSDESQVTSQTDVTSESQTNSQENDQTKAPQSQAVEQENQAVQSPTAPVASQSATTLSSAAKTESPMATALPVAASQPLRVVSQSTVTVKATTRKTVGKQLRTLPIKTSIAAQKPAESEQFAKGEGAAKTDISRIVGRFDATGLVGAVNVTINQLDSSISDNIKSMSELMDIYYNNGSFQQNDAYKTPSWNGSKFNRVKNLDYNNGYAHYLEEFTKELAGWVNGITDKSKTVKNTNQLIDAASYDPTQLAGASVPGGFYMNGDFTKKWIKNEFGIGQKYTEHAGLGYTPVTKDGTVRADVQQTVNAINFYISEVAPVIINGIAHQALSDIRSIGGSITDDGKNDYAPQNLSDAVKLNGNLGKALQRWGLADVVSKLIIQKVYAAIRTNAQYAIETNWEKGADEALTRMFHGDQIQKSTEYDVIHPESILNGSKPSKEKLSKIAHDAGYSWYRKVIANILSVASKDALHAVMNSQAEPSFEKIIASITEKNNDTAAGNSTQEYELSPTEEEQLVQPDKKPVPHEFGKGIMPYTRDSSGARKVILGIYNAEYEAVFDAATDYLNDFKNGMFSGSKNIKDIQDRIQERQQNHYYPKTEKKYMVGDYQRTYSELMSLNTAYAGMVWADSGSAFKNENGKFIIDDYENKKSAGLAVAESDMKFLLGNNAYIKALDLNSIATEVFDEAADQEIDLAQRAYQNGYDCAHDRYQKSLSKTINPGLIPSPEEAGSYAGQSAMDDGTGVKFQNFDDSSDAPSKVERPFVAGYNLALDKIILKFKSATDNLKKRTSNKLSEILKVDGDNLKIRAANTARQRAFDKTSMAKQPEIRYTLKGQEATITTPEIAPGWVVVEPQLNVIGSSDPKNPASVTFTCRQAVTLNRPTWINQTGVYDGQPVSKQLQDIEFTPSWSNGKKGADIKIIASDLTVDDDGTHIGNYRYHLSVAGVNKVLDQLEADKNVAHPLKEQLQQWANQLQQCTGQLTISQAIMKHKNQEATHTTPTISNQNHNSGTTITIGNQQLSTEGSGQPLSPATNGPAPSQPGHQLATNVASGQSTSPEAGGAPSQPNEQPSTNVAGGSQSTSPEVGGAPSQSNEQPSTTGDGDQSSSPEMGGKPSQSNEQPSTNVAGGSQVTSPEAGGKPSQSNEQSSTTGAGNQPSSPETGGTSSQSNEQSSTTGAGNQPSSSETGGKPSQSNERPSTTGAGNQPSSSETGGAPSQSNEQPSTIGDDGQPSSPEAGGAPSQSNEQPSTTGDGNQSTSPEAGGAPSQPNEQPSTNVAGGSQSTSPEAGGAPSQSNEQPSTTGDGDQSSSPEMGGKPSQSNERPSTTGAGNQPSSAETGGAPSQSNERPSTTGAGNQLSSPETGGASSQPGQQPSTNVVGGSQTTSPEMSGTVTKTEPMTSTVLSSSSEDWPKLTGSKVLPGVLAAALNPTGPLATKHLPKTWQLKRHFAADRATFRRFRVTGLHKLGLYRTPNFSRKTRIVWYTRRPRGYRPEFVAIGQRFSKHGTLRYKVRDINRQSATYGLVGYITARKHYVRATYWLTRGHSKTIVVRDARGINGYRNVALTHFVRHYRQGQRIVVKRLWRWKSTVRYQLANKTFITANRQWVALAPQAKSHTALKPTDHYRNVKATMTGWHYHLTTLRSLNRHRVVHRPAIHWSHRHLRYRLPAPQWVVFHRQAQ